MLLGSHPHGLVGDGFGWGQGDGALDFGLFRELFDDFSLGAAKHERLDNPLELTLSILVLKLLYRDDEFSVEIIVTS